MEYSILENDPSLDISVDDDSKISLESASKWASIISILSFVFLLVALGAVVYFFKEFSPLKERFGSEQSLQIGLGVMVAIFIVVALIAGIILYFLLNFANKTARGLRTNNIEDIESGISSLKVFFIIMGVFGMIGLLAGISSLIK